MPTANPTFDPRDLTAGEEGTVEVTQPDDGTPVARGGLDGSWEDLGFNGNPMRGLSEEFSRETENLRRKTVGFRETIGETGQMPPAANAPKGIGLERAVSKLGGDYSKVRILKEFSLQAETKNDTEKTKDYREFVLAAELSVFVSMKPKNPYLQIIHSAGKCFGDPIDKDEYHGRILAFIGDRTVDVDPVTVELTDVRVGGWGNKQAVVVCEQTLQDHFDANKPELLRPGGIAEDKKGDLTFPLLPRIPYALVTWLVAKKRTPWDLHNLLSDMVVEDLTEEESEVQDGINPILAWCKVAAQRKEDDTTNTALVAWSPDVVLTPSSSTQRWIKTRLETTLGPKLTQPQIPPPPTGPSPWQAHPYYMWPPNFQPPNPPQQQKTSSHNTAEKDKFTTAHLCKLAGWCRVKDVAQIPSVWNKIQGEKDNDEIRRLITAATQQAADGMGVQINRYYLEEHVVTDLKQLKFSRYSVAIYSTLEEGFTFLSTMNRTPAEIVNIQQREKNERETVNTRTLTEAKSIKSRAPRVPPTHYEQFKKNVATHSMMALALCGPNCDYYKKLWDMHRVLDALEFKQSYCTQMLWRYLTWIIVDDSRQYFSKILALEDFAGKRNDEIDWPTSLLGLTIQELARLRPLRPGDFPSQWDDKGNSGGSDNNGRGGGMSNNGYIHGNNQDNNQDSYRHPTGNGYNNRQYTQQNNYYGNNGYNGSTNNNGKDADGWSLDRHPKIMALMGRYRRKFNYINVKEILNAAGKTFNDLPCPPRYQRNGRCELCVVDYLGKCGIMGCHFIHAPPRELGDQFATDMCTVIEPGVNKMLRDDYVSPRKRQRRST